jgi:hypothetical protein
VLEDKIVQRAVVEALNALYEVDFLGFSYGFRPGRSPHHALDALATGIHRRNVKWVLDADIRSFFDTLNHGWLVKFLEHRIADRRVVRLIQKWLKAGVLEEERRTPTEMGTVQGVASARSWPTSIFTTCSTSGSNDGERSRRAETSWSCASPMTLSSDSSIVRRPSGSSKSFVSGLRSSD